MIYYGKRGFAAIADHLKTKKHMDKVFTKQANYTLPSNFFCKPSTSSASNDVSQIVNVPLCDRISNSEAMILGVLAEHSLPFSMAPVLIEVSKTLAADKKALNHITMQRNSASYKMRFGLGKTFLQETVNNLKNIKFSLNIDESTSNNNMRVLTILASYFSPSVNRVVVEHLASVSVTTVNSERLYEELCKLFSDNQIPWENLMSILMDSCNVMRGGKSGVETRVRNGKAPHLLDIDGDSCHHIHNACKKFCLPFDGWLETLTRDIFNDIKWSADVREWLSDVCFILNIKYAQPVNMVAHRWLSCYDAAVSLFYLLDALTVLYYSFLDSKEKTVYFAILCSVYKNQNVVLEKKTQIKKIQIKLAAKSLTADGHKRKTRIVQKLFHQRRKTQMALNFYIASLPVLKKYICLFQSKEPLIHKIYEEQKQLFMDFLSCFIKQELLQNKTNKELLQFDVNNLKNHLSLDKMFIGAGTQVIITNGPNDKVKEDFLMKVMDAYIKCSSYMQKKLPLASPLLKSIASIDPTARGHELTLQRLKKLPSLIKNVLSVEEEEKYVLQVHQYQVDMKIPSPTDELGNIIPIDIWWASVSNFSKYSSLTKLVRATLSCFHGPQVEGTFNVMSDVIDKRSGRMNIKTFSSIQTVKYKMLSQNKSAVDFF